MEEGLTLHWVLSGSGGNSVTGHVGESSLKGGKTRVRMQL